MMTVMGQAYGLFSRVFEACLKTIIKAERDGKHRSDEVLSLIPDAVREMRAAWMSFPLFVAIGTTSPYSFQRQCASIGLAGCAATQLSLPVNSRLRQALSDSEVSPFATLLERLPTHAYLAGRTYTHGQSPKELLNHITSSLESDGPSKEIRGTRRVVPPEHLSVEAMWCLEEAQRVMDLDNPSVRAKLTQRQLELCDVIFDLLRQDEEITYAKIGARMSIAENTVKAMTFQIRTKLRSRDSA
jgi:hypothetical protein